MQRLTLYARLMRLDKPVGIWLVFFPAAWAVGLVACRETGIDWAVLFICLLGAIITRSAGCIINDLTDRDLDRHVSRTAARPLASGAVSKREAYALLALLGLFALGLTLLLPPLVFYLSLLAVPFIVAYPWMKRLTWWPQAFLGLTFNLSALIGWAAVSGTLEAPAVLLYVGAVAWTFGYDTIYAHQDAVDDAAIGIKSSARALGNRTKWAVALSYSIFVACLTVAGLFAAAAWPYFFGLGLAASQLLRQVLRLDISDTAGCGALFRSNQWVGLTILLGTLGAGYQSWAA